MKTLLLAAALVIVGCGVENLPLQKPEEIEAPVPPAEENPDVQVIMAVWGGEWCSVCKDALPKVQRAYNALPASDRKRIEFRLYTPTGSTSAIRPTEASAKRYQTMLGLFSANPVVDPWAWQVFKKQVGGMMALPAAAIVDKGGNVLEIFKPGMGFNPPVIVQAAQKRLR